MEKLSHKSNNLRKADIVGSVCALAVAGDAEIMELSGDLAASVFRTLGRRPHEPPVFYIFGLLG